MNNDLQKPVNGFTYGDLNGIELIIKALGNLGIMDVCSISVCK